jgi:ATP-binding cassette subfamily F protein 3
VIQLRALSLMRGGKLLLEAVDLTLFSGHKVGMVGPNGCGKSSLLALLRGELHQESGALDFPARLKISHLDQEIGASQIPALQFVLDGDAELSETEREIAEAQSDEDGHRLALLHERYAHIEGYSAASRAAALLHGLGFVDEQFEKPVAEFSGGWRVRLGLARTLMCRSDLLLLDEPTNHLDLEAVVWLEGWLKTYRGTLILISHDREFLDNTASHILHIDNRKLRLYPGNYSDFERQRAAALALQQSLYDKQQREVAHLKRYIERFRAKATKARQAQSRIKALGRMTELAPAHVDTPFTFCFREPEANPDPLLVLERADCGYGDTAVVRGIDLNLRPGERIGLLGPNGAGKSTLVKLLAGAIAPLAGTRREGKGLQTGYFAQHQLEQLRPDENPLQHLVRLDSRSREQELRDYLGRFDFRGEMADTPVGPFSGGEKSRLALALLIRQRPNLLLLDEPTNHLDLEMRHALTLALQDFSGTLVIVSHDRHLLRATTDELLLVCDATVNAFAGDLDDYREWLVQRRAAERPGLLRDEKRSRLQQRDRQGAARQLLLAKRRPLLREVEQLDRRLAALQAERQQIDAQLAEPALYDGLDNRVLELCSKRRAELERLIADAEERWLAIHLELEDLGEPESS